MILFKIIFVLLIQSAYCLPNENLDEKIINTRSIKLDIVENNENKVSVKFSDEDIIMKRITQAVSSVRAKKCSKDLNDTITGILQLKPWAVAMYDASVKVSTGIEYGVVYQFGNYDQCMNLKAVKSIDDVDISPMYCLADVIVDGFNVRSLASRKYEITNSTLIHWGICVPASCSPNDVIRFFTAATGHKNVTLRSDRCNTNEPFKITTGDIVFGCVIMSFILMVLFSTLYHCYMTYCKDSSKPRSRCIFEMIMKSFSIVENLQKMVQESSDDLGLSCLNGIKAIAMIFIITSHALVFMVGGPVQNSEFFERESKLIQNAFLLNSPLLVDSFLLISGFLFARLILIELEKRKGKINFGILYIFRYIRLTPAYIAMIALYTTWFPKMGSGPLWKSRIGLEQERCEMSWWANLLYINNYVGSDNLCMFQSWYLATDTQLFVLAPLILYPLWRWRKVGVSILSVTTVITIIIPFVLTYVGKLDPTFLAFADEITDLSANEYFVNVYVKTHMRATAYVFGILTGFLVHIIQEKILIISRPLIWFFSIISIIIGSASMMSIIVFFNRNMTFTVLENSLYAGLHRFGWSFATGWLIIVCVTGYANPLKNFLSSRGLVPLSRLTYCAYLTNGFVELYQAGSIRAPKFLSITNLLGETLSHTCLTFLAALILCLLFESPIHGIEKIFLRKEAAKRDKNATPSMSTSEESA